MRLRRAIHEVVAKYCEAKVKAEATNMWFLGRRGYRLDIVE